MGKIPGAATIQTRTTIGTSTTQGHWSRDTHRTMCPDGEGSWCGYNTDQDNYRHKHDTGVGPIEPCALMGKVPGAATIQTRTTIGTSMGHWSRAHRTMCPDGEDSWCGYNTDQDNYRHKHGTLE